MDNVISILQPLNKADENTELLLELLKNERKINLARIENQRRKIVELTASRNELLAQQNGISDNEVEQLRNHLDEVVENSKKMAKTLEQYNKDIAHREQIIALRDVSIHKLKKRIQELEKQADEYADKAIGGIFGEMKRDMEEFCDNAKKFIEDNK